MPKIYNVRIENDMPRNAIFVGRRSLWGNPFRIGRDGTREEVIKKFREYIYKRPYMLKLIRENLRGRDLACWCAPLPCHAEVLMEIANGESDTGVPAVGANPGTSS